MNIKDVARIAGVSITTVSRVLNSKPEGISPEKRKYILKIIEETGYRPNGLARGLVTKRTSTIGLMIYDISYPLYPLMARGVEDAAQTKGYNVILCNTYWKPERERHYFSVLKERGVDGIILAISNGTDIDYLNEVIDGTVPIVLFDEPTIRDDVYGVFVNNKKGAYLATNHLIEYGHQRIACLIGPDSTLSSEERLEGYKQALAEANIKFDKNLVMSGEYVEETGLKYMNQIIERKENVTAVFAASDNIAIGVYKAIKSHGYRIPDDFSVVGFDDVYNTNLIEPSITDITQPTYEMGQKAFEIMYKLLNNIKPRKKTVIFEPDLIVRNSTKRIIY
jgi:LacI family transcriptional regulator